MEFIVHTLNWTKGEIFEGMIIGISGVVSLVCVWLFWKFGTTPNARALVIPLLIFGLLSTATGMSMIISNQNRLVQYEQSFRQDPAAFAKQEKQRVQGFQWMYTLAQILTTLSFVIAIGLIWFTSNPSAHAVAIALMMFALSLHTIDYFSKERANIYYEAILQELK